MNSGAETGEATCDERRMYRGRAGRWAVNNRLGLGVGDLCNRRCMYVHVSGAAVLLWPQTLTRAKLEVLEEEILLPVSDDEVLVCPLVDNKLSRLKQTQKEKEGEQQNSGFSLRKDVVCVAASLLPYPLLISDLTVANNLDQSQPAFRRWTGIRSSFTADMRKEATRDHSPPTAAAFTHPSNCSSVVTDASQAWAGQNWSWKRD